MRTQQEIRMTRSAEPKRDNPFQEQEEQGNEQRREAPGVEREDEGGEARRAPGEGQIDREGDQDSDRKIA